MIRRVAAASIVALAALSACSDDTVTDETSSSEETSATPTYEELTPEGTADGGEEGTEGRMTVEGDVVTSKDDRYSLTLVDGWQAYPAPLDENVNLTVLLVSGVNNSAFVPNIVGTWVDAAPGVPTAFEEWEEPASNSFRTGVENPDDVVIGPAMTLSVDGNEVEGLEVTRVMDGLEITQLVYPIFSDDGLQEVAFSASAEEFGELQADVEEMLSSVASAD
ncbi:hypothetical protein [Flaviflexus sp.]|uniref:hypothetical protein n=1 Tax=Flaviflexus sp. TaxID=1969482 RepID=UPI003F92056A